MYNYSTTSKKKLERVHPDLVMLAMSVLHYTDATVVYGDRTIFEQKRLFLAELSKTLYSKHLIQSDGYAHAIDLAPYIKGEGGIPWNKNIYFYHFSGIVLTKARDLDIQIRWGGDWDMDKDLDDQRFMDLVHFELIGV